MKSIRSLALAAVVALTTIGTAHAQYDPGLGTATLTINGTTPSVADPVAHFVPISTTWTVAIADPANVGAGFILVADIATSPNAFPTPWGGSVDMAAPTVVLDGISFSQSAFDFLAALPFSMTLPPLTGSVCFASIGPSVQAITGDATNAPFFLRNTQAGQPTRPAPAFTAGAQTLAAGNIGDDAFVTVPVQCTKFNGVNYTQMFVSSNGVISFAVGSTDFSATTGEFTNGFRTGTPTTANPGVAAMWGDYARAAAVGDTIVVTNDTVNNLTRVDYLNQQHWNSQTPAGSWSVTFDNVNDSVTIDMTGYLVTSGADTTRIFGVTDGLSTGTTTIGNIAALPGGSGYTTGVAPSVAVAPESICETVALGIAPSVPTVTFFHTGGAPNDSIWTVVF